MQIVILTKSDYRMLIKRYLKYDNSMSKMLAGLKSDRKKDDVKRLKALKGLEDKFNVDLGSVSYKFLYKDELTTPPAERLILNYVATWAQSMSIGSNTDGGVRDDDMGGKDSNLLVNVDRIHEVIDLVSDRVDGNSPTVSDGD